MQLTRAAIIGQGLTECLRLAQKMLKEKGGLMATMVMLQDLRDANPDVADKLTYIIRCLNDSRSKFLRAPLRRGQLASAHQMIEALIQGRPL